MAWYELYDSRQWSVTVGEYRSSVELHFMVTGTLDDRSVNLIVQANAPRRFRGLFLQEYRTKHLGGENWDVRCTYGIADIEQSEFTFDTTGATIHVDVGLANIHRVKRGGGVAPDIDGALNWDGQRVNGLDVPASHFAFTETHTISSRLFTNAYKIAVANLSGTVNNAGFRGFPAGEVLFRGATGRQQGFQPVRATYYFERQPNRTTPFTQGGITIPNAEGWWHIGFTHIEKEDAPNNRMRIEADAAYVDRVLNYGSFAGLGIGTVPLV